MPRVEPISDNFDSKKYFDELENPDYVIPVERKRSSLGLLNGEVVIIDYGS